MSRSARPRSSDQSKSDGSYEYHPEQEVVDATITSTTNEPISQQVEIEKEDKSSLNANAADFVITPKNQQVFDSSEQPQISFIAAMPSPPQQQQSAAPLRQGIYGDTTSNSPKLGGQSRIDEASSNSPLGGADDPINPLTLKKMELSRKAWDNAPSSRQLTGQQALTGPDKVELAVSMQTGASIQSTSTGPIPSVVVPSVVPNQEFDTTQVAISSEATSSSWQTQPNPEQWSNGGKSSQNNIDAWSSNNKPDNWKKNEMVPTPVSVLVRCLVTS